MKTSTPPIVLVLLGICIGTGFGWLLSLRHQKPAPVIIQDFTPPAPVVLETPVPTSVPMPPVIVGDWRLAEKEIRGYAGEAKGFDSTLNAKIAAFPDNPTAKVALLFAAVQWADRLGDSSATNRKKTATHEFHHYWKRGLLWEIESLQYRADIYSQTDRSDNKEMEEYCVKEMKRMCEEQALSFRLGNDNDPTRRENFDKWRNFYQAALDRLGQDGRKLDVLEVNGVYHDASRRRIAGTESRLFLSEMLRASPGDSAFNWVAAYGGATTEEKVKIDEVRAILIRLLDHEAEEKATMLRSEAEAETRRIMGNKYIPSDPTPPLTDEELTQKINEAFGEYEKENKEYHDLTADPPLPKPGEKSVPKPVEKLVPYLKDPTNKDPKANGLGLSLEALADVTRADRGPLPFPLPLQLSGLEGARHPNPPPPGMISDRAKTQLTYKPRRALLDYIRQKAGRDFPENYGKTDAPINTAESFKELLDHKGKPAECYFLIGRNLEHAQRLLLTDPIQVRRSGVGLAEVAATFVGIHMQDKPLSAAIMDLYVMPYLHLGHKRREDQHSKVGLLTSAKFVYSESDFPDKLQLAAEESLYEATDLNGQDAQRHAIAQALLRQNKPDEAITILGQITDPAMVGGAKSFIETIRKKHPGPNP